MINKTVICVIPARLASTRFPKKVLTNISGKPMLQRVYQAASTVKVFAKVIFAIDSTLTAELLNTFNAPYVMTSPDCPSGTDRVIEAMEVSGIKGDVWVNWQGDEPFITPEMIDDLLQGEGDILTLKKRITSPEQLSSPNIAKVVCDEHSNALYFSRSLIPFYRDNDPQQIHYKHVGIYAYTTEALKKIKTFSFNYLEQAEKLEQLRFLANGLKIRVNETQQEVVGIDTVEDLKLAEKHLYSRKII